MANSLAHQEYGRTRVEWLANLNTEYKPHKAFRRTSIICTIGMPSFNALQPRPRTHALTLSIIGQAPRRTQQRRSTCFALLASTSYA